MLDFVNGNVVEKSIEKQIENKELFVKEIRKQMDACFILEVNNVLFATRRILESNDKLVYIQEAYPICYGIISEYSKLIDFINLNGEDIETEEIIQFFCDKKEVIKGAIEGTKAYSDNPIIKERKEIVDRALIQIKKFLIERIQSEEYEQLNIMESYEDIVIESGHIYKKIFVENIEKLNEIYYKTINELNTIEKRLEATMAIEYILKRRKELEEIVKYSLNTNVVLKEDVELFTLFRENANKLYQGVSKKEQEIFSFINNLNYDEINDEEIFQKLFDLNKFKENIENSKEMQSIYNGYQLNTYKTIYHLYQKVSEELNGEMRYLVKELLHDSDNIKLLSVELVTIMKDLITYFAGVNTEAIHEENKKIIRGIIESFKIKYETMKENNYHYNITKKEDLVSYEKRMMDFIEEIEENIEEYFRKLTRKEETEFVKVEDKVGRIFKQLKELNRKYDISYMKNEMLFELVTLDEIISHSLSKINTKNGKVEKDFCDYIFKASKKINQAIENTGLEIIDPEAGSKFNGNEHEVITVNERVNYKKGQIYLTYSRGYKYCGYPIIRANVAVAK